MITQPSIDLIHCPHCGAESQMIEGVCAECLAGGLTQWLVHADRSQREDWLPMEFAGCVLERRIGRGGMGMVFAARQLRLDRAVAVKVLAAGLFADHEVRERFLTEAQTVARLEHPGIVSLLEAGEWEEQAYFIMPLLTGGSLAQRLKSGCRFTHAQAVALMVPLARAVHYAHQRGVLHRDIKPGNILLDDQSNPFLTDFGIAKFLEGDTALTRTRTMIGTPSYMSPEQAGSGVETTTATDVYGLGAVLYELLTGQPPFAADTTLEMVQQVLTKEPRRPALLNERVDRDLETICLKCLEKDPAARYLSAAALADDLEHWQRGEPVDARRASPLERGMKWARRHPVVAAASLIAVLAVSSAVVIGTVLSWQLEKAHATSQALAETRRSEVARLRAEEVADSLARHDGFGAERAAAECLAMEEAAPPGPHRDQAVARARERVAAVARVSPRLLHGWKHETSTAHGTFSPDGNLAACLSGGALHLYDCKTGERLLGPLSNEAELDLSYREGIGFDPAGQHLWVVARKVDTLVINLASVKERRWLWRDKPIIVAPCFDRTGERLLASTQGGVRWIDAATGQDGPLVAEGRYLRLALSPDGHWAAMSTAEGDIFIHDARRGVRMHGPLRIPSEATVIDLSFSPDSQWFAGCTGTAQGTGQFGVWHMPDAVMSPPAAAAHNHDVWSVDFSPDSRRLLAWGFANTRVRDPSEKSPPSDLFAHPGLISMAAWSPDGRRIVTCGPVGAAVIWDVRFQQETGMRLPHESQVHTAAWSPDGKRILTTGNDGFLKLWQLPADDFSLLQIQAGGRSTDLDYSADGSTLKAVVNGRVKTWDASTGTPRDEAPITPTGLPLNSTLSEDGSLCAAVVGGAGDFEIIESASRRVLHRLHHPGRPGQTVLYFAFSPDGKRLLSMGKDLTMEPSVAEVWNTTTGHASGFRLTHHEGILTGTFSPDGRLIATGGVDMTTRLWNAADGTLYGELPRHGYWVWDVAFSPDGNRIATASADHTARVWDIRTLTAISAPLPHSLIVQHLAWNPDGTRLATADAQGLIRVWATDGDSTSSSETTQSRSPTANKSSRK